MNALWLENQRISLRNDLPIPKPGPGSALVRVHLAGICATDLEMVRGYYPFTGILGHEFVGSVVQAPGADNWVGERVVGEINISCYECTTCRKGDTTHCEKRQVLGIKDQDGAFAEYLCLPIANLVRVPDGIPDRLAVFCEPLAAAMEIVQQIQVQPTTHVLLIGAGRLGQLIAQALTLTGCELSVLARYSHQRQILEGRDITTINEKQINNRAWDIVIDATGSASGFDIARRAVRPRGTIVLKSTYKGQIEVNLSALVVDEITIIGSRCGPFPPALRVLRNGLVDPSPLISAQYPLTQAIQAFEHATHSGAFKILIDPRSG